MELGRPLALRENPSGCLLGLREPLLWIVDCVLSQYYCVGIYLYGHLSLRLNE